MHTRHQIERALDDGRLFIKCSGGFFMARRTSKTFDFGDGTWLVRLKALKNAFGFITNVADKRGIVNGDGREYIIDGDDGPAEATQ